MKHVVVGVAVLGAIGISSAGSPQSGGAGARKPDACALLTKADLQKATGRSDAMRMRNMPDELNGSPVCTIDGGADLDIELIAFSRTVSTPLTTPKGAESITGVGAGAFFMSAPGGNFEIVAIKTLTSKYLLHVGLQSKQSPQAIRPIAISLAQSALAKLE
jgi:hypothetical protein